MTRTKKLVYGGIILGSLAFAAIFGGAKDNNPPIPTHVEYARRQKDAADKVRVFAGPATLRSAMLNPNSFTLSSAILLRNRTVCYQYRAQNGFGGMNVDSAVMTPMGKFSDTVNAWEAYCKGKPGEEFAH